MYGVVERLLDTNVLSKRPHSRHVLTSVDELRLRGSVFVEEDGEVAEAVLRDLDWVEVALRSPLC